MSKISTMCKSTLSDEIINKYSCKMAFKDITLDKSVSIANTKKYLKQ